MADTQPGVPINGGRPVHKHLKYLAIIWIVALVPRLLVATTAVAPARDAFRYLAAAQAFERLEFLDAVRSIDAHPLYPLTLLAARCAWSQLTGMDGPYAWVLAGQAWSIVCSLAFLSLAYVAGVGLWNCRVACLGAIAVSIVPRQVNYAADVLSDTFFSALWMASFASLVWTWRRGGVVWLPAAAGALAGLAYWTRIEATVLPCAFLASAACTQLGPHWRWRWPRLFAVVGVFLAVYALFFLAYVGVIGALSPRQAARALLGGPTEPEPVVTLEHPLTQFAGVDVTRYHPMAARSIGPRTTTDEPLPSVILTPRAYRGIEGYERTSLLAACRRLVFELSQETRGWLVALALFAVVDRRRTRTAQPAGLLVGFALAGCAAMLVLLQIKAGYISGRYLTPVLPLFAMYAVTGAEALVARVQQLPRLPFDWVRTEPVLRRVRTALAVGSIGAAAAALCVPGWFVPLHRYRWGHMAAARWLASHSAPSDLVFDPNFFSSFFASRTVWVPVHGVPAVLPARFAVIDVAMIYRTDNVTHRTIANVNAEGRLVACFPKEHSGAEIGVYVFEMPTPGGQAGKERGRR